jgi:hypothetical protein
VAVEDRFTIDSHLIQNGGAASLRLSENRLRNLALYFETLWALDRNIMCSRDNSYDLGHGTIDDKAIDDETTSGMLS